MEISENCVIKTEDLSKEYRLGLIGSGTLRSDLQSKFARMRGKPDPNLRIGAQEYSKNEKFLALDGINIEINRGDRVGIIGANGAGKSTLLKILSRITSPTDGQFCYRGRISSMLEVGTGFHAELTGRENIYLNGAILGMNKSEVDGKIDKIIEFSECEKFIDTPVKRYSSGMFVKLAFAVASHLDSEIMIMDEVLAVGDMKFQKKCISKMRDLAIDENRTILYVSHNMNTIQELCNRCIVLEKGKKVFDGGVDDAIQMYFGGEKDEFYSFNYTEKRKNGCDRPDIDLKHVKYIGKANNFFHDDEKLSLEMTWENKADIPNLSLRIEISNIRRQPVTSYIIENFYSGKKGETHTQRLKLDISKIAVGGYYTRYVFYNRLTPTSAYESVEDARGLNFNKRNAEKYELPWNSGWGNVMTEGIELED